ncbi:glycosyltransferase family 39 protein [Jiulongibacter sp. NS-SX5]|uniref:glycosyltransferase family 39 protein n=1 Tax=Jiulongibacter sp. NS-SX5 TaxID=3463854 RepID=UPI004058DE6D
MRPANYHIFDDLMGKRLLLVAMILCMLTHGVIEYFTLPGTYDAFVHMFFADHYSRFWFEPWEYRWYTGFLTVSYPPLMHQLVGLLSKIFPMKVSFAIFSTVIMEILIIGIYRFSKIIFDKTTAGIAAILTVVLSSIVETLHVYGQMPTLTGLSFLLNALPFLYQYMIKRKPIYLIMALSFLSVTISSHHVTAIFGMVFFIAPALFMALADGPARDKTKNNLFVFLKAIVIEAVKRWKEIILFGVLMIVMAIGLIFPYWYWSKTDPITQVSIPHGSRDNFFEVTSSGLIFYIIPLILIFALLPAISYTILRKKRFIGWAVSFYLCLLLGSGGSTPIPKMMLGETAFNILTLDRFGFWASIIAIPFMAKYINSFVGGPVKKFWVKNFGQKTHFLLLGTSGFFYFLFLIFVFHLGSFRPLQPKQVEIEPIINFLNRDEHMRWRYLTLGFGDQMAWLGANTMAATVDGNYHSARRLPELTTRPVERLENAKFNGDAGLASLNDFLTNSEKYSLKYVFSNDRFYDPLLYYSGWSRTIRLENGIMVWEKGNISTIKPVTPKEIHPILKITWGTFPISSLVIATLLTIFYLKRFKEQDYLDSVPETDHNYSIATIYGSALLPVILFSGYIVMQINELLLLNEQKDPETAILNFYNHLDFQRFETAFHFFKPTPTYTLDQYLLEKSVNDGGLLPSYAKLDSISTQAITANDDKAQMSVYTIWRTSVGNLSQIDTLILERQKDRWYIIPKSVVPEVPEFQMRSYTFTLFKKQGKRVISSFPTVKDDRVKKPFAAYRQANIIENDSTLYLTGAFLNADDIPINVALKALVTTKKGEKPLTFYAKRNFQYNLWPKASTFFEIDLGNKHLLDSLQIEKISLYADTDVSQTGYIHGGTLGLTSTAVSADSVAIQAHFYNELSTDINIPGVLLAERDQEGIIRQVQLDIHRKAVRSGLNLTFDTGLRKVTALTKVREDIPFELYINGSPRKTRPDGKKHETIEALPHCFISQAIYLQ